MGLRGALCIPIVCIVEVSKHNETDRDDSRCHAEYREPNTPRLVGNDFFGEKIGNDERCGDEQIFRKLLWRSNQIGELARTEDKSDCQRQREKAAHEEPRLLFRFATPGSR